MIGAPTVNLQRILDDLETLSRFTEPGQSGWTRRVFSNAYIESRTWLAGTMRAAGLAVARDAAGNLVGEIPSRQGPFLVTGSHTDTVASGGRFDGPLGVLAAIEVARCLRESGRALEHGLRVVDFVGEEPNDFGVSCVGSRAIAGTLTGSHLAMRNPSGVTLADAVATVGGDAAYIKECVWPQGSVRAFVELHIEQGPILEQEGIPIGVVRGIAGIERIQVVFEGESGHAGTTPMHTRRDALGAAAEAVLALERLAARDGGVGTVGRIEIAPGALNVIPGHAAIWAEFRHTSTRWLDQTAHSFTEAIDEIAQRRGVTAKVEVLSRTNPTLCSPDVTAAMRAALDGAKLRWREVVSGAGHDTVQMAHLGPVGMLFVPSAGGRSHCPEEMTLPEHVELGGTALLATLLELDHS